MSALLMTAKEAADVLRVSRSKVYELMNRRELRYVYLDGCRRIPVADVEAYIAALLEEVA